MKTRFNQVLFLLVLPWTVSAEPIPKNDSEALAKELQDALIAIDRPGVTEKTARDRVRNIVENAFGREERCQACEKRKRVQAVVISYLEERLREKLADDEFAKVKKVKEELLAEADRIQLNEDETREKAARERELEELQNPPQPPPIQPPMFLPPPGSPVINPSLIDPKRPLGAPSGSRRPPAPLRGPLGPLNPGKVHDSTLPSQPKSRPPAVPKGESKPN